MVKKAARKAAPKKAAAPKRKVTTRSQAAPKKKAAVKKKAVTRNRVSAGKATLTRPGHGGARKNAGRKAGAATKRTREIADKLAETAAITPLEYMLETLATTPDQLRQQLADGDITETEFAVQFKALRERRDWAAQQAAPYIHPRLSSMAVDVKNPLKIIQELSDDDLDRRIAAAVSEAGINPAA